MKKNRRHIHGFAIYSTVAFTAYIIREFYPPAAHLSRIPFIIAMAGISAYGAFAIVQREVV